MLPAGSCAKGISPHNAPVRGVPFMVSTFAEVRGSDSEQKRQQADPSSLMAEPRYF